ncbi:MAG TPA: DUF2188 domain-containing protein, partial [Chitinophagaceae bacterium]
MIKKNQHVIPLGRGWAVVGERKKRLTVISDNQKDAISFATKLAKSKHVELIIHGRDGKIRSRKSFRKVPIPEYGNGEKSLKNKNIYPLKFIRPAAGGLQKPIPLFAHTILQIEHCISTR